MRQDRLMKFVKNDDFELQYHLGETNIVINILSKKSTGIYDDGKRIIFKNKLELSYGTKTK